MRSYSGAFSLSCCEAVASFKKWIKKSIKKMKTRGTIEDLGPLNDSLVSQNRALPRPRVVYETANEIEYTLLSSQRESLKTKKMKSLVAQKRWVELGVQQFVRRNRLEWVAPTVSL